jgi:hypothetical protein
MSVRTYPVSVSNSNVPKDVYLVADESLTSGELHYTYYIDREGNMFMVADWKDSKPAPVTMHMLTKLTGDSEQMITARCESWFRWN